jgi:FAD/FMN-containing dehydrogenase
MKRVEVDPDKRVARAEAGSLVRDVDEATQHFGLATTLGTCPTVGIAGLTLGGGAGVLNVEVWRRVRQPAVGTRGDGGRQTAGG